MCACKLASVRARLTRLAYFGLCLHRGLNCTLVTSLRSVPGRPGVARSVVGSCGAVLRVTVTEFGVQLVQAIQYKEGRPLDIELDIRYWCVRVSWLVCVRGSRGWRILDCACTVASTVLL